MSYIHPTHGQHLDGNSELIATWRAYNPSLDALYWAYEHDDGWFSVDADEWFGEFPSREAAEEYLPITFVKVDDEEA